MPSLTAGLPPQESPLKNFSTRLHRLYTSS